MQRLFVLFDLSLHRFGSFFARAKPRLLVSGRTETALDAPRKLAGSSRAVCPDGSVWCGLGNRRIPEGITPGNLPTLASQCQPKTVEELLVREGVRARGIHGFILAVVVSTENCLRYTRHRRGKRLDRFNGNAGADRRGGSCRSTYTFTRARPPRPSLERQ